MRLILGPEALAFKASVRKRVIGSNRLPGGIAGSRAGMLMAGLKLKTGPALPNLAFHFPRGGETLYGSGDLSLFPEIGGKRIFLFSIYPTGAYVVHGSALKGFIDTKSSEARGLPEG